MSRHRNSGTNRNARPNKHSGSQLALPQLDEEDLYAIAQNKEDALFLFLEGVQDPHNLGACLRSADGAGVDAIITPAKGAVPVTTTVIEIACGGATSIPVVAVKNLVHVLRKLKEYGCRVAGTSDRATEDLYHTDLTGPLCLVMGSEAKGIRQLTAATCDHLIRIPMQGQVECLNVSVSTGVCLYEVVRQRLMLASTAT